mgnify:CR=1 FL=1
MYKYGIISTASITKRFVDGLKKAGDEVVCIGSRDIQRAKQFALDNSIDKYYGSAQISELITQFDESDFVFDTTKEVDNENQDAPMIRLVNQEIP